MTDLVKELRCGILLIPASITLLDPTRLQTRWNRGTLMGTEFTVSLHRSFSSETRRGAVISSRGWEIRVRNEGAGNNDAFCAIEITS